MLAAAQAITRIIEFTAENSKPIPYHISILTDIGWVLELLNGHPKWIHTGLGVHKHVFHQLITELQAFTVFCHSKHVTIEEQLDIFLYTCVTSLSLRHIREHFQRSNSTISRCCQLSMPLLLTVLINLDCWMCRLYFKKILTAFSDPNIYSKYVQLPHICDPTPPEIFNNPKFYPFFTNASGAINGTHISCCPSASE
ncbi:hypothetical protein PAXRUDRAFT_158231 [Paxillus rubicundulus Ve08.2h10]|uniref:DUF8040 domain-containing protein n=1 Tax=Paxillus rubicundulus Ve08.2h10 TaxID=930991 RepID=A0A0D0D9U3_9AGAM|nr:hypothetical protein PAXRUDRAFT_158231 [Paxillus rubicundulus Ve08.2h10]